MNHELANKCKHQMPRYVVLGFEKHHCCNVSENMVEGQQPFCH